MSITRTPAGILSVIFARVSEKDEAIARVLLDVLDSKKNHAKVVRVIREHLSAAKIEDRDQISKLLVIDRLLDSTGIDDYITRQLKLSLGLEKEYEVIVIQDNMFSSSPKTIRAADLWGLWNDLKGKIPSNSKKDEYVPSKRVLNKIGRLLRDSYLTEYARQAISQLLTQTIDEEILRVFISDDDLNLPWELCLLPNGKGTWCERFSLGRMANCKTYYYLPDLPMLPHVTTVLLPTDDLAQAKQGEHSKSKVIELVKIFDNLERLQDVHKYVFRNRLPVEIGFSPELKRTIYGLTDDLMLEPFREGDNIIAIVAHFTYNKSNPPLSYFQSMEPESLEVVPMPTIRDIASLVKEAHRKKKTKPIIMLSSCNSGTNRPSDKAFGVSSLLVEAGAAAVIGTMWGVPLEAGLFFAKQFLNEFLIERNELGEALRLSRLELKKKFVKKSHEAKSAWAAYTLCGIPSYARPAHEMSFKVFTDEVVTQLLPQISRFGNITIEAPFFQDSKPADPKLFVLPTPTILKLPEDEFVILGKIVNPQENTCVIAVKPEDAKFLKSADPDIALNSIARARWLYTKNGEMGRGLLQASIVNRIGGEKAPPEYYPLNNIEDLLAQLTAPKTDDDELRIAIFSGPEKFMLEEHPLKHKLSTIMELDMLYFHTEERSISDLTNLSLSLVPHYLIAVPKPYWEKSKLREETLQALERVQNDYETSIISRRRFSDTKSFTGKAIARYKNTLSRDTLLDISKSEKQRLERIQALLLGHASDVDMIVSGISDFRA